ncbi:MAG: hypothetical protein ACYSSI_11585 [Planctomycetota bacterium]|jgi:hypothetical protein
MAKKVKNMLKNNVVLCVLILVAIGITSIVFAADVVVKQGAVTATKVDSLDAPTDANDAARKKYVDDATDTKNFGAYTTQDDESNNMLKAHAYLANQDGFVTAHTESNTGVKYLMGYIGTTSDPAGAGDLIAYNEMTTTGHHVFVMFPVASGKYFELTTNSTNAIYIRWHAIGTLVKPTDQD